MAVVVRGGGRTATLRRVLRGAGVPVDTATADLPVRDEAAVRPFLTLLRCALDVVAGAEQLDPADVVDVLTSPVGGADAVLLRRLRRSLRRLELDDGGGRPSDVLLAEAVLNPFPLDRVGPEAGPARRAHRVLAAAVDALRDGDGVEVVLWRMWSASGLAGPWRDAALGGGPGGGRADRDLDAVLGLFDAAARFVDRLPGASPADFLDHVLGQDVAGDTLVARAPAGESVALVTPAASAGLEWDLVVVAGVQEGVWPDLRLRGSLLGSTDLVDLVTGRGGDPRAARAQVRHDETRLFHVAVTRARHRLVVTAVRSEDEQPSPFLDVVDPLPHARAFTDVARPLTLPGLVAELRRELAGDDPGVRGAAVTALATLAAQGVPGADPAQWWALRDVSDDRPRRAPGVPVSVSPSTIDHFGRCRLQWVLRAAGGDGPSMGAQDIGTLVHEVAHDLGDTDAATYAAELEARWGRLGLAPGWLSRRDLGRAQSMTDPARPLRGRGRRGRVAQGRLRGAHPGGPGPGRRGRPGRPGRGRCRRPGAGRRPQDRREQAHPRRGAPARAARGLPARRRGGRLHPARRPVRRRGPAAARPGRGGQEHLAPAAAAPRARRRARVGPRARRGGRRRDGRCGVRGDPGIAVRHLPGQGLLPRLRGGEAAVSGEHAASGLLVPDGPLAVRWGAVELARALGQAHAPTPEQVAVIEAPLRPLLVVAGAGSGKTETMAARVVWLVANDLVHPDEVLGLTFTRKAAGELSERLSARLATLREAGLWTPRDEAGAAVLDDVPTVSTYHAYAGRIVREHGVRLGVEAESRLLSEAAAWQVAHEAVASWDGPMDGVEKAESTVTTAVVDLAGEMAEHLVGVDDVARHLDEVVAALEGVPSGVTKRRTLPAEIRDAIGVLRERRSVLPLVERYHELKRSRDAMDFADQVALAARIATTVPQVGAAERARFRAVLLDEFQDTSEAQLQLLRSLFVAAGSPVPVTAVGDPHQSIYGWRGASSTTLHRFREDFVDPEPPLVLPLSTSWRNDTAILEVANLVAEPLARSTRVPVGLAGGARRGRSRARRHRPARDHRGRGRPRRRVGRAPALPAGPAYRSGAVPQAFPVRPGRRGAGGARHPLRGRRPRWPPAHPRGADLVALLWVVQDPTRGDRLMRLLTGPSCRLGAADLDGLGAWARARQRTARRRGADLAPDASERSSIVEALDDLPPATWVGEEGQSIGPVALERLTGLGAAVRRLRSLTGLGLAELAAEAEVALGLDIEVLARPGWSPGAARAHLDAFADVAATFAASRRPGLRSAGSSPGSTPRSTRSAGSTSAGSRRAPTPCR